MSATLHVPAEILRSRDPDEPVVAEAVARDASIGYASAEEYLRRLCRRGELVRRGPGVFTAPRRGHPELELTPTLKRVNSAIYRHLPMTPVVGWTTEWLAPYAHNVPNRHWTILEAAPFTLLSVADILARDRLRAVVDPRPRDMQELLRLFEHPLILWPHGETYLAVRRRGLLLPEPERLVVDFYFAVTRRKLPYPENDLAVVISGFIAEGDLNIGTILAYARRRRIGPEMTSYLTTLKRLPPDVMGAVRVVADKSKSRSS